jgi:hypothetical protein
MVRNMTSPLPSTVARSISKSRQTGAQGLQRDTGMQFQVLGFVDLTHAAAAEEPHDTIASPQDLAGDQHVVSQRSGFVW